MMPSVVKTIVKRFPILLPYLRGRARWLAAIPERKTYEYFLRELERMVTNVYNGQLGGAFIDILADLIVGQLTQAFERAWEDEEGQGALPDYLNTELEAMVLSEYDHVDQYYRDIVDARVDGTPLAPLLARAAMWANRFTDAYNRAVQLITAANGGNLLWTYGDTEHCETCRALDGIVARATEWEEIGVKPQSPPNSDLECGGWRCQCVLAPTDQRRSPNARDRIMQAIGR